MSGQEAVGVAEEIKAGLTKDEELVALAPSYSLPHFVIPATLPPMREKVAEIQAKLREIDQVAGKISEVESALSTIQAETPVTSADLAEQLLAGKSLDEVKLKPAPKAPEAFAHFSKEQLHGAIAVLSRKKGLLEAELADLQRQLKDLEASAIHSALVNASKAYVELFRSQVATLHAAIDAGHTMTHWNSDQFQAAWRDEMVLAPPLADKYTVDQPDQYTYGWPTVAKYGGGKGVGGEVEIWRRFIKSAVGVSTR